MQHPGLADDAYHRRFCLEDLLHQIVVLNGHTFAAGHAERGNTRRFPSPGSRQFEELEVLGIAPGPAAFDVMNAELIELFGDAQLVHRRKIDSFTLAAVAQGRIVDFDFWLHYPARAGMRYLR